MRIQFAICFGFFFHSELLQVVGQWLLGLDGIVLALHSFASLCPILLYSPRYRVRENETIPGDFPRTYVRASEWANIHLIR